MSLEKAVDPRWTQFWNDLSPINLMDEREGGTLVKVGIKWPPLLDLLVASFVIRCWKEKNLLWSQWGIRDGVFFSMRHFALLSAFPAASCFSAAFPLPARCFCFSFRAERGLVTRPNHRLRRRTFYRSYMLMRLLIPARFLAHFNDWFFYLFRDLCLAPRGN